MSSVVTHFTFFLLYIFTIYVVIPKNDVNRRTLRVNDTYTKSIVFECCPFHFVLGVEATFQLPLWPGPECQELSAHQ